MYFYIESFSNIHNCQLQSHANKILKKKLRPLSSRTRRKEIAVLIHLMRNDESKMYTYQQSRYSGVYFVNLFIFKLKIENNEFGVHLLKEGFVMIQNVGIF